VSHRLTIAATIVTIIAVLIVVPLASGRVRRFFRRIAHRAGVAKFNEHLGIYRDPPDPFYTPTRLEDFSKLP
jgi:hypothetical protein